MPAYLFNAPAGFPGGVSRPDEVNIEPAMLVAVSTVFAQGFGIPMKYVSGGIQQFNGGAEAAADFAGTLVREVPGIGTLASDADISSGGVPNSDLPQGLMVRGYMMVKCWVGTPARGGAVYVQIITSGGVPVGGFRTTSDGGNSILLTPAQAEWATDGVDANLLAELRVAR